MDRFVNNNEFDKDVIFNKLADISSKLEEEQTKTNKDRDIDKERRLMYEQMIQGMKLNTMFSNRKMFF